jgi:MraZ protein
LLIFFQNDVDRGGAKWGNVGRKEDVVQGDSIDENAEIVGLDGFVGDYTHTMDSKKRLTIPSDWREMVGVPRRLYILPGINVKCLCVYPARDMAPRLENLRKVSIADEKATQFARTLAFRSDLVTWDAQGRIRVKDRLLEYAGLESQVTLVGRFNVFELWSPEEWNNKLGSMDESGLEEAARYANL